MKFNVVTKNVESVGELSSKKITLSGNAKAFRLIFGTIYPDIIKAIVRELFTNAWDSQKVVGTLDREIEIHLPSNWEPYFSIRDYGTGMLPDIVDDIYSRVFESTKDKSDEEAGMYGMGSKTPLGYTDSFTVTSYVDGTYWFYDIYMDKDGSPVISLKATGETEEPNGVEVSLGVLESDFETFRAHAEYFALGANTPISINRQKFLSKREIFKSGPDWQLFKDSQPLQIRMGCVLYRVNRSFISSYSYELKADGYNNVLRFLDRPFVIDFNIGDFDVTGSREDIVYNKEAVRKFLNKLTDIVKIFEAEAYDDIKNSATYMEAYIKNREYQKNGLEVTNPRWKSLKLREMHKFTGITKIVARPINRKGKLKIEDGDHMLRSYDYTPDTYKATLCIVNKQDNKVKKIQEKVLFCLNEFKTTQIGLFYAIDNYTHSANIALFYVEYTDVRALNRMKVYLPKNTKFVELESIELPKKERVKRDRHKEEAKLLSLNSYSGISEISRYGHSALIEPDSYYVKAEYSSYSDPEHIIMKALVHFDLIVRKKDRYSSDVIKEKIYVLGKSQQYLAPILDLVDLVEAYREDTKNFRYNRSTIIAYVMKDLREQEWGHAANLLYNPEFQRDYLADYKFVKADVAQNYNRELNEETKKDHDDMKKEILAICRNFVEEVPILKFVSPQNLRNNLVEILLIS